MTPLKSIRAKCIDCAAGEPGTVRFCDFKECPLHPLRMGKGIKGLGGCMKPIRAFCLWCCCDQPAEARLCPSDLCALHPYRMGRRPATTPRLAEKSQRLTGIGTLTPAEGQARQE